MTQPCQEHSGVVQRVNDHEKRLDKGDIRMGEIESSAHLLALAAGKLAGSCDNLKTSNKRIVYGLLFVALSIIGAAISVIVTGSNGH